MVSVKHDTALKTSNFVLCADAPTQAFRIFFSKMMRYRALCPNYNLEEDEDFEVVIIFMMLKLVQSLTNLDNKYQRKIANTFLPMIFSICFGCSKEPSH